LSLQIYNSFLIYKCLAHFFLVKFKKVFYLRIYWELLYLWINFKTYRDMINEVIKKNGITYGVMIGIASTLITATIYAIDLNLFTAWWMGLLGIVISLTISIILLSKTKKELNGIFPFKEAFTTYFIAAVIGILISTIFNILLFNVIDPSAKDTLSELMIKYTVNMMQKFGSPASVINETIEKMKLSNPYSTLELLKGSVFAIVISAVFGLIFAAFFKSKTIQE
jgi:hypothetical protein